jgi:mono/diheme cytochrome c family protein
MRNLLTVFPAGILIVIILTSAVSRKEAGTEQQPISKAVMERGKTVYTTYCLACHQADASGVPRMNPPLIKTPYVTGDKKKLINILLKGLDEEIEIAGEYYTNPMPAHAHLTDQEIADVLTYVRNSFGNKSGSITKAEVATERNKLN